MNTFLFNAVMVILLTAKLGQNFPIINQKLPSTYGDTECPPGFLPCVSENKGKVSNASSVEASTLTGLPSNTTEQQKTPEAPSVGSMGEIGNSETKSLQHGNHLCPPGVWVC